MITIYIQQSVDRQARAAMAFFDKIGEPYEVRRFGSRASRLTTSELLRLALNGDGIESLIKSKRPNVEGFTFDDPMIQQWTYMEVIAHLAANPKYLKNMFISDGKKVVTAINSETLGVFVPHDYRKIVINYLNQQLLINLRNQDSANFNLGI
jgi:arsenate reductase-like glutaredoxin family protein